MKACHPLVRLLLALSLGALLLAGLTLHMPAEPSAPLAATPAPTQAEPAADDVIEDDLLLVAKTKRVKIKATRFKGIPFITKPTDKIMVDVNPTLSGKKSYRVVLKVKHNGGWIRCATKWTHNDNNPWFTVGKAPHEFVVFHKVCKHKANRKYRVIVPAQHGFARTVVNPTNYLPS